MMLEAKFEKMTPCEYISYMFEHTDEDGILYIPGWYSLDEPDHSFRCQLEWSLFDYDRMLKEFETLYVHLERIAAVWDRLTNDGEANRRILNDDAVFETWQTYIKDYALDNIDMDKVNDIADRIEIIGDIKKISKKICEDQPVDDYEKSIIKEYLDVSVSKEEYAYYDAYIETFRSEAKRRVNNNICASAVINRARRVCRLISLGAPQIIVHNEARTLAAAMVVNRYGKQKDTVNDAERLRREALDELSDEELDELYRPRKMNARKSLAPLFVHKILVEHSSISHPLRQKDILDLLRAYPYELVIERKALSRIIHNLTDSGLNIHSDAKIGTWYEQNIE